MTAVSRSRGQTVMKPVLPNLVWSASRYTLSAFSMTVWRTLAVSSSESLTPRWKSTDRQDKNALSTQCCSRYRTVSRPKKPSCRSWNTPPVEMTLMLAQPASWPTTR